MILPFTIISVIGIFGLLLINSILINTAFNSSYFKSYAVVAKQLPDDTNDKNRHEADKERLNEILSNGQGNNNSPLSLSSVILIIDNNIKRNIRSDTSGEKYDILRTLYNLTHPIQIIEEKRFPYDRNKYPYSALYDNRGIGNIEIRSNY